MIHCLFSGKRYMHKATFYIFKFCMTIMQYRIHYIVTNISTCCITNTCRNSIFLHFLNHSKHRKHCKISFWPIFYNTCLHWLIAFIIGNSCISKVNTHPFWCDLTSSSCLPNTQYIIWFRRLNFFINCLWPFLKYSWNFFLNNFCPTNFIRQ